MVCDCGFIVIAARFRCVVDSGGGTACGCATGSCAVRVGRRAIDEAGAAISGACTGMESLAAFRATTVCEGGTTTTPLRGNTGAGCLEADACEGGTTWGCVRGMEALFAERALIPSGGGTTTGGAGIGKVSLLIDLSADCCEGGTTCGAGRFSDWIECRATTGAPGIVLEITMLGIGTSRGKRF